MGKLYIELCYWLARWLFGLLVFPYWLQNEAYDEAWDLECRRLLDQGATFKRTSSCRADFGGHAVWIVNHPYASFKKYEGVWSASGLPSRLTRYRMMRRLVTSNFYKGT